jgi:hypothetical protein
MVIDTSLNATSCGRTFCPSMPARGLPEERSRDQVLCEAWARHLAHEVQKARLHAEILSLKTVAARIDSWTDWHGALPEKGRWVTVAQQIGVSPEALYREMAKRRKHRP